MAHALNHSHDIPYPFRRGHHTLHEHINTPETDTYIRPENPIEARKQFGDPRKIGRHATQYTMGYRMKNGQHYKAVYTQLDESARRTDALVVSTNAFVTQYGGIYDKETRAIADMGAESVFVSIPHNGAPDIIANAYAMNEIAHDVNDSGMILPRGYSRGSTHGILLNYLTDQQVVAGHYDYVVYPERYNPYEEVRAKFGRFLLNETGALIGTFMRSPGTFIDTVRTAETSPRLLVRNLMEAEDLTSGVIRHAAENLPQDQVIHIRGASNDVMGFSDIWRDEVFTAEKYPNAKVTIYPNGGHTGYFDPARMAERMMAIGNDIDANSNR